jgi:4,5-dihydroxyphthalate decarboxylase
LAPNKRKSGPCPVLTPWPYSIEQNRIVLETLLDYAAEQGLTDRRLAIEEIFAPSTLD